MSNAEEFLNFFNRIESFMKVLTNSDNHVSFKSLLHKAKRKNRTIAYYFNDLSQYGDLRNAIVHGKKDDKVIAEPHEEIVNELKIIYDKLASPRKVYDIIKHKVFSLSNNQSLSEALEAMNSNQFSQIPVYEKNNYKGMLDSEMISFWLASNIKEDIFSLSETRINKVLENRSGNRETLFKSRELNVYDLIELYKNNIEEEKKIQAVIITQNGKVDETPLTIITDYDIPRIVNEL